MGVTSTSPYSFHGLGEDAPKIFATAREGGMPIITEVMDTRDVELVARYADILQVGTRNMTNVALLEEVGRIRMPVMLKRGMSSTIEEWLQAAEYIANRGNYEIMLCERGIRTFETYTRNTFDVAAIPAITSLSHLPVIADPSHGTGRFSLVGPVSRASVAAGADGLMIEVHPHPEKALKDGAQSLTPANFIEVMNESRAAVGDTPDAYPRIDPILIRSPSSHPPDRRVARDGGEKARAGAAWIASGGPSRSAKSSALSTFIPDLPNRRWAIWS